MGTLKKYSNCPDCLVKIINQRVYLPKLYARVFIWQWWPKVSSHLHQPKVQMNDLFTFHDLFYWYECFQKLTTINHCKHSPTTYPQKDVRTKSVFHQHFIQLENNFSKEWPKLRVKFWDSTHQSLASIVL